MSADGDWLAWIGPQLTEGGGDSNLYFAHLTDTLGKVHLLYAHASREVSSSLTGGTSAVHLAWRGDAELLVTCDAESGLPAPLLVVPLRTAARAGWAEQATLPPTIPGKTSPVEYGVVSSTDSAVLAVEGVDLNKRDPNTRAVLVDPGTGRVTSVIATPRAGRNMDLVSGGPRGYLYRTSVGGNSDFRYYWRFPDEPRGERLMGVPSDVDAIMAQP